MGVRVGTPYQHTTEASSAFANPSGMVAGELKLLLFTIAVGTLWAGTDVPAGFTLIDTQVGNGGIVLMYGAAWGIATGSEGATQTFNHPTGGTIGGQILSFEDIDNITPQDITKTSVIGATAATTVVVPSGTTVTANAMEVFLSTINATTPTDTISSGTETYSSPGPSPSTRAMNIGYRQLGAAGASGTVTTTFGVSAKGLGLGIFLRPQVHQSLHDMVAGGILPI